MSKKARFEIFKRDKFVCQYCGDHPPKVVLHVDHIIPIADGGSNDDTNLITACINCNQGKAANSLDNVPQSLADRAVEIQEAEEQISAYSEIAAAARARVEEDCWLVAEIFQPNARDGYPKHMFTSIKRFVKMIGVDDACEAAEIAESRDFYDSDKTFKYFCGICWNKHRGITP